MSKSLTRTTSQFHHRLKATLAALKGNVVRTAEIRQQLLALHPELQPQVEWITLADHCSNRIPKGACECAGTSAAIVEAVGRAEYRVL